MLKVFLGTVVITGITGASTTLGLIAQATISESTPIAVSCAGAVVLGSWYLSARLQRIEDSSKSIKDMLKNLPCVQNKRCLYSLKEETTTR